MMWPLARPGPEEPYDVVSGIDAHVGICTRVDMKSSRDDIGTSSEFLEI